MRSSSINASYNKRVSNIDTLLLFKTFKLYKIIIYYIIDKMKKGWYDMGKLNNKGILIS